MIDLRNDTTRARVAGISRHSVENRSMRLLFRSALLPVHCAIVMANQRLRIVTVSGKSRNADAYRSRRLMTNEKHRRRE
jgi:hypothetical protein